ncbi:hypothetical protein R1flu_025955 [Riccia fluitans]|uniref:Dicer-like protein 1 n=1 Tax=Riccia fluitans TaxID=41844 RepID=A0ABD1XIC9_9MARC
MLVEELFTGPGFGEAERERERARLRERAEQNNKDNQSNGKEAPPQKERAGEERARKYQLEVLEQAKVKNTIAFLETGAGKTLIAVLLMQSKYEMMRKERKKMLAVFLVPKVPLVYQQAEVIRDRTGYEVGHYCGEMGQDFWDARRWQREFETKDVLVMTAQILLNILRHSIVRMEAIHLLILDECHHAVKKHPYSLVMSEFYHITPKHSRPAVFGMTASPVNLKGVSSQEDCAIKIRNLESKLDSIVCTIKDRKELEMHVPTPSESLVEYDKAATLWSLREQIKQMEAKVEEAANASSKRSKWRFMGARDAGSKEELRLVYGVSERTESDGAASLGQKLRAIIYALDELGQWCAYKVAMSFLTSLRNDERANHQLDVKFQESYLKKVVVLLRCRLSEGAVGSKDGAEDEPIQEADKELLPEEVEEGELPDTQVVSGGEHVDEVLGAAVADGKVTPKVQSLIKILLGYQHTDDFRAIIFVEQVVAALILPKVFAELPSLKFVKCASLIGHNNNQDMRTRQMQETIAKFRDGRVTLLVATSVAEEGLDIRQCNVVIRFDLAKTVLAYIQSRGRARKPGSDYVLMLERGNTTYEAFLRNALNSEETLRKEAIERTELSVYKEAALLASLESVDSEVYQVPSTGAMVSLNSAVGLIHFYCSQLPTDRYSILRPEFIMKQHDKDWRCKVHLTEFPAMHRLRLPFVWKHVRSSTKWVHLLTCYYQTKVLGKKQRNWKTGRKEQPLPGTARHREYYPEGIAEVLQGDWIKEDLGNEDKMLSLFMYKVACENKGFSKDTLLMETSRVLTMSMDLFVARTMTTKASLVFSGPIEMTGLRATTPPPGSIKSYLFVPIQFVQPEEPSTLVHWALIDEILETEAWKNPLQRVLPDVFLGDNERALGGDRREYGFGNCDTGKLISWNQLPIQGRGSMSKFVRYEMNCESSFPQKDGYLGPLEYTSYADYYKKSKAPFLFCVVFGLYGVELVCKKQPLIRGRGVSHGKNLLSPRFESSDGGTGSTESCWTKRTTCMLPPELCLVHPLPGPLVRGAQRLPSVMRRVESMLLAVQLKHLINYPIPSSKVRTLCARSVPMEITPSVSTKDLDADVSLLSSMEHDDILELFTGFSDGSTLLFDRNLRVTSRQIALHRQGGQLLAFHQFLMQETKDGDELESADAKIHDFVQDIQTELDKPGVNSFGLGDFKAPKVLGGIQSPSQVFEPLLQPMVTPQTLPMHPVLLKIQKKMAQKLAARNALVILKERESSREAAAKAAPLENGEAGREEQRQSTTFTRQTLNDICLKRQWPMPQYKCVTEGGPAHAKRFTYSVRVHTTEKGWTDECVGEPMPSVKKAKDSAAGVFRFSI